jgi:hypothetical protein
MASHIVLAFRMPPTGLAVATLPGREGTYLARARSLCARGEALGGRLVTWCAALLAIAWDPDSIEEAVMLGTSVGEETLGAERKWACGMAEGELEPLAADGARMQLAWGPAVVAAESLARIALPGELLVDGDVQALRAGHLAVLGPRVATESGRRVRGWRLDLAHPWKGPMEGLTFTTGAGETDRVVVAESSNGVDEVDLESPESTQETPAIEFSAEELSTAEVLEIVEASVAVVGPPGSPSGTGGSASEPAGALARERSQTMNRVRTLVGGGHSGEAGEILADLRRLRASVEDAPPSTRCQAALALAMTLAIVGRPEEALLDTLDALARARETQDPKALSACTALLVKLYTAAGRSEEAAALRESE